MARTRSISPKFFEDDTIGELDPLARLAFIGLWTLADREGRLEDKPRYLKFKLLPYDDVDIDSILNDLAAARTITRYFCDGKPYIQIRNFSTYQRPHPKEIASVICPPEPEQAAAEVIPEQAEGSTETRSDPPLPSFTSFTSLPSLPAAPSFPSGISDEEKSVWWEEKSRTLQCSDEFWATQLDVFEGVPVTVLQESFDRLTFWLADPARANALIRWRTTGELEPRAQSWLRKDAAKYTSRVRAGPSVATPLTQTADEIYNQLSRAKAEKMGL